MTTPDKGLVTARGNAKIEQRHTDLAEKIYSWKQYLDRVKVAQMLADWERDALAPLIEREVAKARLAERTCCRAAKRTENMCRRCAELTRLAGEQTT